MFFYAVNIIIKAVGIAKYLKWIFIEYELAKN